MRSYKVELDLWMSGLAVENVHQSNHIYQYMSGHEVLALTVAFKYNGQYKVIN